MIVTIIILLKMIVTIIILLKIILHKMIVNKAITIYINNIIINSNNRIK